LRTIVKGKSIDVSEPVREYAERKMRRLERFLDDKTEALVELSIEQHRGSTDSHIVEVTLVVDGQTLRSHAAGPTHQASLDLVIDRVERQAVDTREKPRGKARPDAGKVKRDVEEIEPEPAQRSAAVKAEPEARPSRIVKTKRFAIEPMFEEDAVARMEELGHKFFLFVNAENERLCLLYKRDRGDYGLIEPIIAGQYTPGRNGHRQG
jgi:putative sigma-54 modulation protein